MIDDESIKLLQYLSLALENMSAGGTQYFKFEIRGKIISGCVEIKVEDYEAPKLGDKKK